MPSGCKVSSTSLIRIEIMECGDFEASLTKMTLKGEGRSDRSRFHVFETEAVC
jgi:hypothetical protein